MVTVVVDLTVVLSIFGVGQGFVTPGGMDVSVEYVITRCPS
mgnify:FL=1